MTSAAFRLHLIFCALLLSSTAAAAETADAIVHGGSSAAIPADRFGYSSWWARPGYWRTMIETRRAEIAAGDRRYDIVFCGDSITQNWEGWPDEPSRTHLSQLVKAGRLSEADAHIDPTPTWLKLRQEYHVLNLGVSGDQTQHLLWRLTFGGLLDGYTARFFAVAIGTNNKDDRPEDVVAGVRAVVETIREKHPESTILLHALLPRGRKADAPERLHNNRVNELLRPLADGRRVVWVDFGARLLAPDGTIPPTMMTDALHPTDAGYRIWRETLLPYLQADELRISVFEHSLDDVARQRGVSLSEAAELLRQEGVRGFDCCYDNPRLAEYAATGLKPINLYGSIAFFSPDAGTNACERFVRTATDYKVPRIMVIPDHFTNGEPNEPELTRIEAGIRHLVAVAKSKGVAVMVETFGPRPNACSYAKYVKRFLTAIPDLRFALDTGNLHYSGRGDDIVELARFAGGRVEHVHLKDWQKGLPAVTPDGRRHYVSVGQGAVPNEACVRVARANGFDGWYTLEHPVGDTLDDVRRQIGVLRTWIGTRNGDHERHD